MADDRGNRNNQRSGRDFRYGSQRASAPELPTSPSQWLRMGENRQGSRHGPGSKRSRQYFCKICGTNVPAVRGMAANQVLCPRCLKPMTPMD